VNPRTSAIVTQSYCRDPSPRLVINRIERVPMPQPVFRANHRKKKKQSDVFVTAREDADRTLSVEYKRVRSISSVSLVNVSFAWDINGEAFRHAILVCRGSRFAYTHAHLLDH
jgi:hypothetical protein